MSEPGHNSQIEVDGENLVKILARLTNLKEEMDEANGRLRSEIKTTLDNYGWHKAALGFIRQIDDMSISKRNDFLASFEPMFDAMLTKKWRDEQQDLFSDKTETEDD